MKDVFGNELRIGDRVATTVGGYTDSLVVKTVVGFTPKMVKVEPGSYGSDYMVKYPRQLAKG